MAQQQRVTWEDASLGQLEVLEDTYTRTAEYCVSCGRQGTWASGGPVDEYDPDHHICPACGTIQRLGMQPGAAEGFWLTIVRQLQLAEEG